MRDRDVVRERPHAFESIADAIMYRWKVERDTWVGPTEIARARSYLEQAGIATRELPDGRFEVVGETGTVCEAARLVLLGIQHLLSARRTGGRVTREEKAS